jgi:diguanylate cyclase (GGDEF)-like protein
VKLKYRVNPAQKLPVLKLRLRLIGVVLIALIPSFVLIIVILYNLRTDLILNSEKNVYQISSQISSEQVNIENSTSQLMTALSQVPSIQYIQPESCDRQIQSIISRIPFYLNLAIADSSGNVLCSGVTLPGPINISQNQFFINALNQSVKPNGKYSIYTQLTIGPIVKKETIIMGQKMTFINGLSGVIYASINLNYISGLTKQMAMPQNSFVGIVGSGGTLLYDSSNPQSAMVGGQLFSASQLSPSTLARNDGMFSVDGDDGVSRIYAATPFGSSGHGSIGYVVVGIPAAQVDALPNHDIKLTILGVSIAALAAMLAAWFIGARAFGSIQQKAISDQLTGLLNRSYGLELAEREFKRFQRQEEPLSAMILDLDFFKKVNDTYGHQVGDSLLIAVADAIKEGCRSVDIVMRYGGEEFLIVLPNADRLDATEVAERVRIKVSGISVKAKKSNLIKTTVSVGVAEANPNLESLDQLIANADEALYVAKSNGRNQVRLSP